MAERNAAVGTILIGKQTNPTTVVTPTIATPYYSQSMDTQFHDMSDEPAFGNRFKRFQTLQGIRSHTGSVTVMAEPNTIAYWLDMLATKTSTTGANPYTHTFGQSITVDPNPYTMDIILGSQVIRFFGVQASKTAFGWNGQKMELTNDLSALGSFYGREIASVATNVITLKTDYDPNPTIGLVASDLVAVKKVDGSVSTNFTVTSFTPTTVTLSATAAAFSAGDMLVLRAPTPTLAVLTPFLWPKTQFYFAADAATALTNSATLSNQVRLDAGTQIDLMNEFDGNEGEPRSGGFDPASLIRARYDLSVKIKKYFDLPEDIKYWNSLQKRSLLMRSFSGSTNQYELRVIINNMTYADVKIPSASGAAIYEEITGQPNYDTTDGQGFNVVAINTVATV